MIRDHCNANISAHGDSFEIMPMNISPGYMIEVGFISFIIGIAIAIASSVKGRVHEHERATSTHDLVEMPETGFWVNFA